MADEKLAELLKTQKSLTEWLEDINHSDATAIRKEDIEKPKRLAVLNETIGLPFDKPTQFEAADLRDNNPEFAIYLKEHGDEPCRLRLMPKKDGLPKFRMRGLAIKDALAWAMEQDIKLDDYIADFVPHPPDYSWATIFVVNKHGIQGEIVFGSHHQLTQGFHDDNPPMIFRYDFKKWEIEPKNKDALEHVKKLASFIHVPDKSKQKELAKRLGSAFVNDYLEGYFETAEASLGIWFIDYNQSLGKMYADAVFRTGDSTAGKAKVKGQTGSPGKAKGPVRLVHPDGIDTHFPDGAVLVCGVTTPDYVPLMQRASAIVTDQGGILSHAAIVARELKKPCIVGTGDASAQLKEGQIVSVDADIGTVF